MLGAMIVTPMFAQQKDLYPELEGPGPVVIIAKDKNGTGIMEMRALRFFKYID